jgi:hypothetical protein
VRGEALPQEMVISQKPEIGRDTTATPITDTSASTAQIREIIYSWARIDLSSPPQITLYSLSDTTRKLSVTVLRNLGHFSGRVLRKKSKMASVNWLNVA